MKATHRRANNSPATRGEANGELVHRGISFFRGVRIFAPARRERTMPTLHVLNVIEREAHLSVPHIRIENARVR